MTNDDLYGCYEALARVERVGTDYRLEVRLGAPSVLVLAIHGGPIEKYTDVIANRVAGTDFSYYALVGMRRKDNKRHLHIKSERFREPVAMQMVARAQLIVSIHGEENLERPHVMLGGRDDQLKTEIQARLKTAGFEVEDPPRRLSGTDPCNICNCGPRGVGAQLEISMALRESLSENDDRMEDFVLAIREALAERRAALEV